jgi:hypothetical protein
MDLTQYFNVARGFVRDNSPAILTALGVTGTLSTAYLTGKAAYESYPVIANYEHYNGIPDSTREMYIQRGKLVWKLYIPAFVSGTSTVLCIVIAARVGSRRTAAITAAYTLSERALVEYREKVAETIGTNKEQKLRDEIAQDKVAANPPSPTIITGDGQVLCYEMFTGRYFNSTMEHLRRAENNINAYLIKHDRATVSDFYDEVGLPYTSYSGEVGWESDKMLELEYSTVLSEDSRPCIAFAYNYTTPV